MKTSTDVSGSKVTFLIGCLSSSLEADAGSLIWNPIYAPPRVVLEGYILQPIFP